MPKREKRLPGIDRNSMATYLAQQPSIVVAYVFGSVARGDATHLSDVDIGILLEPGIDAQGSIERQLDLMVALDTFASQEVQVTILNRAPPILTYQVIREGVLLYERDRAERVAFEVKAMKIYFDLKPMIAFHRQALIERIREEGLGKQARDSTRTLEAAERLRERLAGAAGG
jgi:hypothetical protein